MKDNIGKYVLFKNNSYIIYGGKSTYKGQIEKILDEDPRYYWFSATEHIEKSLGSLCYNIYDTELQSLEAKEDLLKVISTRKKEVGDKKWEYNVGDTITFNVNGESYSYKINKSYLSHNQTEGVDNAKIFKVLGIQDKGVFCTKHYGYYPESGAGIDSFPTYNINDLEALNNIINALRKECEKYNSKAKDYREESKYTLGSEIIFDLGTTKYVYNFSTTHLFCTGGVNNAIFDKLGLSARSFASVYYGYESKSGSWPTFKEKDYAAGERLVEALQEECKKYREKQKANASTSIYGKEISFQVGEKTLNYIIKYDHLENKNQTTESNSYIFRALGIKNEKQFCREAYGYAEGGGNFPTCKSNDWDALQRVIDALYAKCRKFNSRKKDDKENSYTSDIEKRSLEAYAEERDRFFDELMRSNPYESKQEKVWNPSAESKRKEPSSKKADELMDLLEVKQLPIRNKIK